MRQAEWSLENDWDHVTPPKSLFVHLYQDNSQQFCNAWEGPTLIDQLFSLWSYLLPLCVVHCASVTFQCASYWLSDFTTGTKYLQLDNFIKKRCLFSLQLCRLKSEISWSHWFGLVMTWCWMAFYERSTCGSKRSFPNKVTARWKAQFCLLSYNGTLLRTNQGDHLNPFSKQHAPLGFSPLF